MNEEHSPMQDTATPFQKFEELTRRLLAVPKREVDEQRGGTLEEQEHPRRDAHPPNQQTDQDAHSG
jgi:hypothetical protein